MGALCCLKLPVSVYQSAATADGDAEVICLDGAEEQHQQPGAAAGRRPRRGRGGRGGSDEAPPAASVKLERDVDSALEVKAEQEAAEEDEVVVLDSPKEAAAPASAGGHADAAAAAAGELRGYPVGTPECPVCAGGLQEASKALKVGTGRLGNPGGLPRVLLGSGVPPWHSGTEGCQGARQCPQHGCQGH